MTTLPGWSLDTLPFLMKKAFENIVGKGENAGSQHFLLFPRCFIHSQTNFIIRVAFISLTVNVFNLADILSIGENLIAGFPNYFPRVFFSSSYAPLF